MSFLITSPDVLVSAATDVSRISSRITTACVAAGPTTGLAAAAEDEISTAIAGLFSAFGQEYRAVIMQAAALYDQFTLALTAAGNAYAQAEAASAAAVSSGFGGINASLAPAGGAAALTTARSALGDPLYALIMGGTGNPTPTPEYVTSIYNSYIKPVLPSAIAQGLFTPEQFWPVTPQLGNMTFAQSVTQGVQDLNNALLGPGGVLTTTDNSALVFGYSQSATIATDEIRALMALPTPPRADQLSFMLIGDPNNPVGGLLERFPGFYIPFLDVPFNGATPQSPWHTTIYTYQYDGIADAPQFPLDVISDLNAFMGYFQVHSAYPTLTATQVAHAVPLPTDGGNTSYYMILTQNLPLLSPIRAIP